MGTDALGGSAETEFFRGVYVIATATKPTQAA